MYDLQTCFLAIHSVAFEASVSPLQFIELKEGRFHPIDKEQAWKTSYVAQFILIHQRFLKIHSGFAILPPLAVLAIGCAAIDACFFRDRKMILSSFLYASIFHLIALVAARVLRRASHISEIINTPHDLIENLRDQKNECKRIEALENLRSSSLFDDLPEDAFLKVLFFVTDHHDLKAFSLTCRLATKICFHVKLQTFLYLEKLPKLFSETLRKNLDEKILNQMRFIRSTSLLKKGATNIAVSDRDNINYPPGVGSLWGNPYPKFLPEIESECSSSAPFITINPDWLDDDQFFCTITPVKTPALIFTYHSNYEYKEPSCLGSNRFYHKNRHVLILTQISPYLKNEWWIILQAWNGPIQCFEIAATKHKNREAIGYPQRLLLNRCIRVVLNEEGHVVDQCKAVWNWFTKFLAGQEVGFFDFSEENFKPINDGNRYFLQFRKAQN